MTDTGKTTPELPRQVWLLRFDDGTFLDEWFPSLESVEEWIGENHNHVLAKSMSMTPVLLHDQDAIDQLVAAAELTLLNLDNLQRIWGKEGLTNRMAETLRAAIARVKGGA